MDDETAKDQVEEKEEQQEQEQEQEQEQKEKETKQEKTFTQAQLNKLLAKEKNQSRNAAFNELGINKDDKNLVTQFKAFLESQKSDAQKEQENKATAERELLELKQQAFISNTKVEAMRLSAKPEFVDDLVTLVVAKRGDTDTEVKDIVAELKMKHPYWFTDETEVDDKKSVGKKGTGASLNGSSKQKQKEEQGLGARLAARKNEQKKKSAYWGSK